MLPWKINNYYIFPSLRVHSCACVQVCVWVRGRVRACVAAALNQHAKRMRRIIFSSVVSMAPPNFSLLCHKWQDFRKNVTEHKTCILIFSTTFIRNISNSKNNSARYCHKCENVFIKYPLFLSDFN